MKRITTILIALMLTIFASGCGGVVSDYQDDIEQAEDVTQAQTEPETIIEELSINDFVYTEREYSLPYYGSFMITGETGFDNDYVPNRLPQLSIDSDDARAINEDIHEKFNDDFDYMDSNTSDSFGRIDYVAYLNGNVLSLVIESRSVSTPNSWFCVYNINVETGERLSDDELVGLTNISLDYAYGCVYNDIEEMFIELMNNGMNDDFTVKTKERSLSDENIHNSMFYFNDNGQLIAAYRYYWIAGAEDYGELLEIDAYIL